MRELWYNLSMKNSPTVTASPTASSTAPQAHKSTLARLLATENIHIQHGQVATAAFNLKTRTLILPMWSTDDTALYDMLVGHEVSHALHTDPTAWREGIDTVVSAVNVTPEQAKMYLNIVEDARIERLIKIKFPGLRRDFFLAYKTLVERKFFGDLTDAKGIAKMCFGDRINLHCKMSIHGDLFVPFSNSEALILREVNETVHFSEVVAVTIRVLLLQIAESQSIPDGGSDGEDSQMEDGEGQGEDASPDKGEGESDGEITADIGSSQTPPNTSNNSKSNHLKVRMPVTNQMMEEAIQKNLTDTSNKIPSIIRMSVPESHGNIVDYTEIIEDIEHCVNRTDNTGNPTQRSKDFWSPIRSTDLKSASQSMAMAFERKKAADLFKRSTVSRTGALDVLRMNQYRWTDDIFRRTVKISKGKNHGVVILLDWSGSMSNIMQPTIGQLLILTDFCRQSRIPFEVFAFTDRMWSNSATSAETRENRVRKIEASYQNSAIELSPICLLNFLSSRMSEVDYAKGRCILWNWRMLCDLSNFDGGKSSEYDRQYNLSGTPTCSALLEVSSIIADFTRRSNIQCSHCVVLTDGEPSDAIGYNWKFQAEDTELDPQVGHTAAQWRNKYYAALVLDDPITGCSYDVTTNRRAVQASEGIDLLSRRASCYSYGSVEVPLESSRSSFDSTTLKERCVQNANVWIACDIIRRRTGAQVHWIGLTQSAGCPSLRSLMNPFKGSDWRREGFVRGTILGWDSAIVINSGKFGLLEVDNPVHSTTNSRNSQSRQARMEESRKFQTEKLYANAKTNSTLLKAFVSERSVSVGLRIVASYIGDRLAQ